MSKAKNAKHPLEVAQAAAFKLAANQPWKDISLRDIADEAEIDLTDLYGVTDKSSLVAAVEPWADRAMSEEKADLSETPRERLFDAIMRRFEHMETERAGVLSMLKGREQTPAGLAKLLKARRKTADWAVTAASLDTGDPARLAVQRLALVRTIAKTERAWKSDEAGDFARTMATLDAELIEIEERLGQFSRFRSRFRSSGAASSQPEAPQAETGEA
ncbi:MAG: hypothetical protein AAF950_10445 [Pseudomonadota bacterium]